MRVGSARAICRCRRRAASPSPPAWTPASTLPRRSGLEEGDAHVIRNAGGLVSDDAIRSLVISQTLLGTEEAIIIGHSDCGILTFTNEDIREKLAAERGADGSEVDFLPFANVADAVRESVRAVTESPLLPESFGASGFVYEVESGRIVPVT